MQEEFMHLSAFSWNIIFWVTRYVLEALLLAYLGNVLVKRKDIASFFDTPERLLQFDMEYDQLLAKEEAFFGIRGTGTSIHYTRFYVPEKCV